MDTQWKVIHESDENGQPTCWSREINHPIYGKYVWISRNDKRKERFVPKKIKNLLKA